MNVGVHASPDTAPKTLPKPFRAQPRCLSSTSDRFFAIPVLASFLARAESRVEGSYENGAKNESAASSLTTRMQPNGTDH